ncbi:hypothetical protein Tco_1093822 [Tanacetum coccineum]|uniref:Uncharacterized protein n=1 Tax=Tanacetum coccineum TaxID=301880 RepID=A0ABQ5IDU9_9ASTR
MEQESSKKQKVEEDKESEELKKYLEIVSGDGDDVTIDATPLSIKSPTIIDYKIYQEGKKSYFQIIRADVDYECEMAFELLRLVKKQLKEGYGRIVGIKSLLEVTAAKVYVTATKLKLNCCGVKVTAAGNGEGRNSSRKRIAIQPLGIQHSRTPNNDPGRFKVSGNSSRALYEIGSGFQDQSARRKKSISRKAYSQTFAKD